MSEGQASVRIVKSTDTIEIGDIRSFVDREMKNLQETAARRLQTLEELVVDIATAQTLEALEEHEIECSLRFAALRDEFDEVLDDFEGQLELREQQLVTTALEAQLTVVVEDEDRELAEVPTSSSDLVLRLRDFLDQAEAHPPSLETARQKLTLARTVLRTLRSLAEGAVDSRDAIQRALDQRDIEDLSPIVVELALLVSAIRGGANPEPDDAPVPATLPVKPQKKQQPPPSGPALHPLAAETVKRYEDDYYRHVGLFQTLLKTASTDAHYRELIEFRGLLDARREDLSRWRREGGYTGTTPLFFADSYEGALPGESHVRTKKKDKKKRKKTRRTAVGSVRTSESVSQILRDFTDPRRPSSSTGRVGRKGNFNSKIFITTGLINPRANKRRGDW